MTVKNDRFWAKVFFKEFIKHYRKMDDMQKAKDIDESMDALENLDDSGESFGAKMVRWSMERAKGTFASTARENGKLGGRPPKEATTPCAISTDDNGRGEVTPPPERKRTKKTSSSPRLPSWQEVLEFVNERGLDYTDAREWYEMTVVDRKGNDKDGNRIANLKASLVGFCKVKYAKRRNSA